MASAIKPPKRDMRERLEMWRQEKGRTPMKRLSYMHDYATPEGTVIRVHPVVHSPSLLHSLNRSLTASRKTEVAARSWTAKKPTLTPFVGFQAKTKLGKDRENQENVQLLAKLKAKPTPKQPRREQLEKWLSLHGSTVKRHRPDGISRASTDLRRAPLSRTVLSKENQPRHDPPQSCAKGDRCFHNGGHLKALKEQFQRDIDDTISQIHSDQVDHREGHLCDGDVDSGIELARQLDFDGECPAPTVPEHKRRRSHVHFDPSLAFKSTTIRYSMALSEPRRKRRRTFVAATPDSKDTNDGGRWQLLHLTPVRRSTRKNRGGPGLELDHSMCFDSPSEANAMEGYRRVEVVPNRALVVSEERLNATAVAAVDGADD